MRTLSSNANESRVQSEGDRDDVLFGQEAFGNQGLVKEIVG